MLTLQQCVGNRYWIGAGVLEVEQSDDPGVADDIFDAHVSQKKADSFLRRLGITFDRENA